MQLFFRFRGCCGCGAFRTVFDSHVLDALGGGQEALAQTDGNGGNFDEFILVNPFNRLFE